MAIKTSTKPKASIFLPTMDLTCPCGRIYKVPEDATLQKGTLFCPLCKTRFKVSSSLADNYNKRKSMS